MSTQHYNPRLQLQTNPRDLLRIAELDLPTFPFHTVDYRRDMSWTRGANLLDKFGLGAYKHVRYNFHLIGFNTRMVHPHDRWLFRTRQVNEKLEWVRVGGEAPRYSSLGERLGSDLVDTLEGLEADVEDIATDLGDKAPATPGQLLAQAMAIAQDAVGFNEFDSLTRAKLNPALHARHIHDLIHHYPEWLAAHPEAADMPRDLVLRMQGLGGLLDSGYTLPRPAKRVP